MSLSSGMRVTRFAATIAYSLNVVIQPALTVRPCQWYFGGIASIPGPLRQCMTTLCPGAT